MRKFLVLFLALITTAFAAPIYDQKIDPAALSSLYTTMGIHEENAVAETQKQWLRKGGQERWEMAEMSAEKKEFVLKWAKENGIYDAWIPSQNFYEKAFILGATTSRMETRLEFLKQQWEKGVRFNEIVWLTGDRPLDPRGDQMLNGCFNESDAAKRIWEQADLPPEMRTIPVVFVAVPMQGSKRPNTQDTIVAWLKKEPSSCSCLFISDQPFCGYQFAVIKATLPDRFSFDIAGKGVESIDHPSAAAITLDSIARWLYQDSLK